MCKSEKSIYHRKLWEMKVKFLGGSKFKNSLVSRSRMSLWMIRAMTILLLWSCFVHLVALGEMWGPRLLKGWPSCFNHGHDFPMAAAQDMASLPMKIALPPKRIYQNNGYLMISCNGGLNQMRAAICDMVTIARYMNVTLIVPELDKTSFWNDPRYILPLVKKHKILHLNKTDTRLVNNELPVEVQKLRCRVNFNGLRFTPKIEELGRRVVKILREKGPFLVLHLRYEMDMLAFSGCSHGCNRYEEEELTRMRYAYPWWKEKVINSELKRKEGLCPLTPEETALTLSALGIDRNVQIYIAAGEIYGGKRRLKALTDVFPNVVRKETLLDSSDLSFCQNHSSQMAALDYLISLESDIFVPTYYGNMAKVVEGHRRFLGFKKTIELNRKFLVNLIDEYYQGMLSWEVFSTTVKSFHATRMGGPKKRLVIPNKPKEEDYFYANPYECLQLLHENENGNSLDETK
ncbi:hypothetical protein F2Q70_00009522 [Brassica cretica]|uniref:O-fucosyltransferase family protein n=1 Tax=Brassica cretica TaxID=69181 RepID=A0A8S9M1S0_BRACR|nr:hypothetical protein F2Q70_00009522 [Brassica cretica]